MKSLRDRVLDGNTPNPVLERRIPEAHRGLKKSLNQVPDENTPEPDAEKKNPLWILLNEA